MQPEMIEISRLSKQFGAREPVQALSGASFSVGKNAILGLLGPDGAGKTTMLRILATYLRPTEGTATIGEADILTSPGEVREIVGYVPQTPALGRNVSVGKYLGLWGQINGLPRGVRVDRIGRLLESLELAESDSELVLDISAHKRQTMLLAQALLTDPQVLLLDEPLAGLTPSEGEDYGGRLKEQRKSGLTVLVTSSVMQEVLPICTHIVALSEGQATKAYETSRLLKALGEARHARVFVDPPSLPPEVLQALRGLDGVLDVKETVTSTVLYVEPGTVKQEEVEGVLQDAGVKEYHVKVGEFTLGDVFRTLHGEA